MSEILDGWNKELYDNLSFEYLIECAKNGKIDEWNQLYENYLISEWERLFPNKKYDTKNYGEFFEYYSGLKRPDYSGKDFNDAIQEGAKFTFFYLKGSDISFAHLDGANFTEAFLDGVDFTGAHLERVNFWNAHLDGANFTKAFLDGTHFTYSHLDGANFTEAFLDGADILLAHLDGANFIQAHFEGANFNYAIVNGETLFVNNTIDDKTDFTGTSLSAPRIDPELRTKLERNIRHLRWKEWYDKPKLYPAIAKIKSTLTVKLSLKTSNEKKKWGTKLCWIDKIINAFVRIFWWISDYGSSTKRIIAVFFGWNILWAVIYYYLLPFLPGISTTILNVSNIWTAILQTNLMMFSITDLATEGLNLFPMLCVTTHIVVGYFILAALITRLGIMFQNLSP